MDLIGLLTRTFLGSCRPAAPAQHGAATAPRSMVSAPLRRRAASPRSIAAIEAVDKVQKFYADIKQVTAQFRQSVTYDTFGSTKTSDGTVWIQKPGKMRWDYLEKKKDKVVVKKSFISNGSYLYMVEHDNKQVVKKNLAQDLMPVAVSFLYGKGDLKAEFNAELDKSGKYGTKERPRPQADAEEAVARSTRTCTSSSRPKDFHVTQSVIVDSSNNVNHFRFFAPDFEKPIKPTLVRVRRAQRRRTTGSSTPISSSRARARPAARSRRARLPQPARPGASAPKPAMSPAK